MQDRLTLTLKARPDRQHSEPPKVLVLSQAQGLRLSAVNRSAIEAGLDVGMALNDARAIVPGLMTAQATPEADEALLQRLARWFDRYSPRVMIDRSHITGTGPDGLLVDITGCAHLFGGEKAMLADMRDHLTHFGLTVHLALAPTIGAAWALSHEVGSSQGSRPTANTAIEPVSLQARCAPLSITGLRLADPILNDLARFGLKRIGDLLPFMQTAEKRATLVRRFDGKAAGVGARKPKASAEAMANAVMLRLDQLVGHVDEPLAPQAPLPEHRARRALAEPISEAEAIAHVLDGLLTELMATLETTGLGARSLLFRLDRVDGSRIALEVAAAASSRDKSHFSRLYAERIGTLDPAFGIDECTLTALRVEPIEGLQTNWKTSDRVVGVGNTSISEPALLDGAAEAQREADLLRLVDRLANRFGADRVTRALDMESHLPERAERFVSLMEERAGTGHDGQAALRVAPRLRPPRPVRLLTRPEPIDVVAEVPEGPPRQFRWRRIAHMIARAEGPERIEPEWWRSGFDGGDEARPRDYFRIENDVGQRFWVYRDGLYRDLAAMGQPAWFIHGLFA